MKKDRTGFHFESRYDLFLLLFDPNLEYWRIADICPGLSPDCYDAITLCADINSNRFIKANTTFLIINYNVDYIAINTSYAISTGHSITESFILDGTIMRYFIDGLKIDVTLAICPLSGNGFHDFCISSVSCRWRRCRCQICRK